MYRFLLTPRWLGLALVMALAAAVMAGLGRWQLDRYETRSAQNARVAAASVKAPVPLAEAREPWTRVTVTGRYDPSHEILARGRTLSGRVGFEVFTPLVQADGSAVLVDRGWLAAPGDATAFPSVPPAPAGQITVTGALHRPESRATAPQPRAGRLELRRIDPARVALPYPVYKAGYVIEEEPAEGLATIPPDRQNAWQNLGYVIQWWLLAALTLVGFGYLARSRARTASMVSASAADLSSR